MNDWSAGYVADVNYTYGYYPELNPLRAQLAFLRAGLVFPRVGTACELGFGQGLSANLHAAASVTQWHGTDFNPAQAAFAKELAVAADAGAQLCDYPFAQFAQRQGLPEFDYIGLHGIWSWISDENRRVIVDFIARKLKVGGVLYVSYNTLPGWAAFAPMRHLMTEHAEVLGAQGRGIVSRIDDAVNFAAKLLATKPGFARANPLVADRIDKLANMNRHYLAHEYFNRDWLPMHFATMAQWLEPARMQFACSANLLDHIDGFHLTAEQLAFINEIPDPMFRQSTRDFMVNQQFRKDYWVKGARRLNALDLLETVRRQRVVLSAHRADVALKLSGGLGEISLSESIYAPVLDALADHQPKTLAQIEALAPTAGPAALQQAVEMAVVLGGAGYLQPVQEEAVIEKARATSGKLNKHLCGRARGDGDITFLASPVTGGGVAVSRFQQMFLHSMGTGKKKPDDWARAAWETLSSQNQKIMKDGKPLPTDSDNLAELSAMAHAFAQKQLPLLKALGVA